MDEPYFYKFEDKIFKYKLPKGLSYVLQTTDITEHLDTDGLSLTYKYEAENPKKPKRERDFSFTKVELLSYHKNGHRWGTPGSIMDYDRHMTIYPVPAKIRYSLRSILRSAVLPILKKQDSKHQFKLSVYYRAFSESNYAPLDRGGLYIEQDRYSDKRKVLYRNKEFNIDKEIKGVVS